MEGSLAEKKEMQRSEPCNFGVRLTNSKNMRQCCLFKDKKPW